MNVQIDSRKIKQGDTFIALRGISSDGHSYINKAIENGATTIVAEEGTYSVNTIIVSDTREYLIEYLKKNYNKYLEEMKIIGITGTNGKTTSAFLLYEALNKLGIKTAYIGTIGFYIDEKIKDLPNTTPEILDMYEMFMECYTKNCKYIIEEVSSQGLDTNRVEGYKFDYAVLTNISQDHLDWHKTMDNYISAKVKLFSKLKLTGKAIINYDEKYKDRFMINDNIITYGFLGGDYKITNYEMDNTKTIFSYNYKEHEYSIEMNMLGKYNVYNALVVIALLKDIGLSFIEIGKVMKELKSPVGRMDTIKYNANTIVIDYAHTPDAVDKIINTMLEITRGDVYTVFGCTGDRDRIKRPIMTDIVTRLSKYAILTSDDPHNEDQKQIFDDMIEGNQRLNYEICYDRKEAIIKGIELLRSNDVLLILGKGHEEVMIVKNERIPFNDRKVVEEYLDNGQTP